MPRPRPQTGGKDLNAFMQECAEFCARHDLALSTLSQRALSNADAIERLPRMHNRVADRVEKVRQAMAEIERQRCEQ